MKILVTSILVVSYPLLLAARLLGALFGRDPLRLRKLRAETFWIRRAPVTVSRGSYFSEDSEAEGRGHGGFGRLASVVLKRVAGFMAPGRPGAGEKFGAAAERDSDIPDEIYTLW